MLSPRLSSSRSTSPPAGPSELEHRGQSTQPVPPHSLHDWNSVSPSGPAVFFSPAPSHSSQATCRCPLHFGQNCIGNYVDGSKQFESALALHHRTTPLSRSAGSLSGDVRAVAAEAPGLLKTAARDCSVSRSRSAARPGPPPSPRPRAAPPPAPRVRRRWCPPATRRGRSGLRLEKSSKNSWRRRDTRSAGCRPGFRERDR
jgi:hypothetical protein